MNADQPREASGKFAGRAGAAAEISLLDSLHSMRRASEPEGVCGVDFDHDERVTYEDDELMQWECRTCGAEGEVDFSE